MPPVKVGDFVFFRWMDANTSSEWETDHPEIASAWAIGQVMFFGRMKVYKKSVTAISIAAVGDTGVMRNLQIAVPWSWVEKDSVVFIPGLLADKVKAAIELSPKPTEIVVPNNG